MGKQDREFLHHSSYPAGPYNISQDNMPLRWPAGGNQVVIEDRWSTRENKLAKRESCYNCCFLVLGVCLMALGIGTLVAMDNRRQCNNYVVNDIFHLRLDLMTVGKLHLALFLLAAACIALCSLKCLCVICCCKHQTNGPYRLFIGIFSLTGLLFSLFLAHLAFESPCPKDPFRVALKIGEDAALRAEKILNQATSDLSKVIGHMTLADLSANEDNLGWAIFGLDIASAFIHLVIFGSIMTMRS